MLLKAFKARHLAGTAEFSPTFFVHPGNWLGWVLLTETDSTCQQKSEFEHVDFFCHVLEFDGQQERENHFVFFEQTSADVTVQTR